MTTFATNLFNVFAPPRREAAQVQPARPTPGPVLIHDSITAANHTTLLHELWRRAEASDTDA